MSAGDAIWNPTPPAGDPMPLADLALLSLVVAHGTDADLDPRETREVVRQLGEVAAEFGVEQSGADLSDLVEHAVQAYGQLRVVGLDAVVARLGRVLTPVQIARAHAALVGVADADGVVHTMERTLLRHLAQAWGLAGGAGGETPPGAEAPADESAAG